MITRALFPVQSAALWHVEVLADILGHSQISGQVPYSPNLKYGGNITNDIPSATGSQYLLQFANREPLGYNSSTSAGCCVLMFDEHLTSGGPSAHAMTLDDLHECVEITEGSSMVVNPFIPPARARLPSPTGRQPNAGSLFQCRRFSPPAPRGAAPCNDPA